VLGCGVPIPMGNASASTTSYTIFHHRISAVNTITYNIIRTTSGTDIPTTANCAGGSAGACGYIATSQAQCTGLWCSYTDTYSTSTTAVTVPLNPTYSPFLEFWPASVIEAGATMRSEASYGLSAPFICPGPQNAPTVFLDHYPNSGFGSTCWAQSLATVSEMDDTNGTANVKPRINIIRPAASGNVPQGDFWGYDSVPSKTLAHNFNYRPAADATDLAIGNDCANAAITAICMAFRSPVSISAYIGTLFDNLSFYERLTPTQKIIVPPILALGGLEVLGSGCSLGCSPYIPSGTQVSDFFQRSSLGSNWTAVTGQGTWAISSDNLFWTSVGGSSVAALVYTGASFSANQSAQIKFTIAPGSGGAIYPGVCVRMTTAALTGYCFENGGSTTSLVKFVSGSPTNLGSISTPSGVPVGTILYLSVSGSNFTADYILNGVIQQVTATDSTITTGSPGLFGEGLNTTSYGMNAFFSGNLTYASAAAVSQPYTQNNAQLFAALPACGTSLEGALAEVSDSTTTTWGATITGTGTSSTPTVTAHCNGSAWTVAAK
jgi:hypothetical protein